MQGFSPDKRALARQLMPLLIFCGVAAVASAGLWLWLGTDQLLAWVNAVREALQSWLRIIPVWAYWVAFALLPAFGVPLTLFYLSAIPIMGGPFGLYGILGALSALGVNMWLSYAVTDSGLRPFLQHQLEKRGWKIPSLPEGEEGQTILMIRFSPMPYAMQNYLLAMTNCGLRRYMLVSLPAQALVGIAMMLMGGSAMKGHFGLLLLGIFMLLLISLLVRHMRGRLKSSPDAAGSSDA